MDPVGCRADEHGRVVSGNRRDELDRSTDVVNGCREFDGGAECLARRIGRCRHIGHPCDEGCCGKGRADRDANRTPVDKGRHSAKKRRCDVVTVPLKAGCQVKNLVRARCDRVFLLDHRESGSSDSSRTAESKASGHWNVASNPHWAGAAERLEGNPAGVMLVKLLRASGRLAHAAVGKQAEGHAEYIEAGAEVG